jgi:hypothetical protein
VPCCIAAFVYVSAGTPVSRSAISCAMELARLAPYPLLVRATTSATRDAVALPSRIAFHSSEP